MKKLWKMYVEIFVMTAFLCGCSSESAVYLETANPKETETLLEESIENMHNTQNTETSFCYVYVCGAVKSPGVYELPHESRVFEAIAAAGGMTEDADEESLNQAQFISDGQMIKVLTVSEAQEVRVQSLGAEESDGLLNINRADTAEFMTLPGIGQSKAEALIKYREEHGGFSSIEEIMNVEGIKEGVFNKIKDSIKV